MRTRKPLVFVAIPSWAITDCKPDRYTVAAAFQLAGLTNKWVRLTADTQRAVFGHHLFGKCQIRVHNNGVEVIRSVCFGTTYSHVLLDWAALERYVTTGQRPIF
jgi:hypothetical protein